MYLEHSSSNLFSRERLHMLKLLCVQLGILLQNSLLYESVQESMQMYAFCLLSDFFKILICSVRYELLAESLPQMIFCHRHGTYFLFLYHVFLLLRSRGTKSCLYTQASAPFNDHQRLPMDLYYFTSFLFLLHFYLYVNT
jgi:hypothetical protein